MKKEEQGGRRAREVEVVEVVWLKRHGRSEKAPGRSDRTSPDVYFGETERTRRLSHLLLLDHHHPPFSFTLRPCL